MTIDERHTLNELISALKGHPAALALIVTNITLLVFLFYMQSVHNARAKELQGLFAQCLTISSTKGN